MDPGDEAGVQELGCVGVLLNPDPTEGHGPPPPAMGDRYWYPVYEALCELECACSDPLSGLQTSGP